MGALLDSLLARFSIHRFQHGAASMAVLCNLWPVLSYPIEVACMPVTY
jgi:hypothetical protein